jgi:RNA 3'-terminal phosphate cyclase-like protein
VDDIRASDQNPGLRDYEASLLRLLDKLSNGLAAGAYTRSLQSST